MVEVKCLNCSKKANLNEAIDIELLKEGKKVSNWKRFVFQLSKIDLDDVTVVNSYSVIITFDNSKNQILSLREYLGRRDKSKRITEYEGHKMSWISCLSCGTSKAMSFDKQNYYYSIEIGTRRLVAKNKAEFIKIFNTIKNREKVHSSQLGQRGFPKIFWERREEVLMKMELRLKEE